MERTREEHLEWCKSRALEYVNEGDVRGAVTSMLSDLSKHPDTADIGKAMSGTGLAIAMDLDKERARTFIEGFK